MLPFYQATLAYTQAGGVPSESLAWPRAVLSDPGLVRMLATAFPNAVAAPGIFPPATAKRMKSLAEGFGAKSKAQETI